MANRLRGRYGYPADDPFRVTLHEDKLALPLRWKKPRIIFVCSMGDLFHEDVRFSWIAKIFKIMHDCPQHTFILLTKRPGRLSDFAHDNPQIGLYNHPNIWPGTTIENDRRLDWRLGRLLNLETVGKRVISVEPMLGSVNLNVVPCWQCNSPNPQIRWPCPACKGRRFAWPDWVICGAETGPGARLMNLDWARDLRDQCVTAGVPFFFKRDSNGSRLLDGREWNEMPGGVSWYKKQIAERDDAERE